jgi:hypothetical protein
MYNFYVQISACWIFFVGVQFFMYLMPTFSSDVPFYYLLSLFYFEAKWTEVFRNKTIRGNIAWHSTRFWFALWFSWNVDTPSGTHCTLDWDKATGQNQLRKSTHKVTLWYVRSYWLSYFKTCLPLWTSWRHMGNETYRSTHSQPTTLNFSDKPHDPAALLQEKNNVHGIRAWVDTRTDLGVFEKKENSLSRRESNEDFS